MCKPVKEMPKVSKMPKINVSYNFGNRETGDRPLVFIIAEIGINHNGDLDIAKDLIDVAVAAGCDAVKFQKRTPDLSVPPNQKKVIRKTPWGSNQEISLEPADIHRLVTETRIIEKALGDGIKRL
jgi:sialic acid synthase SpsE